MYFFDEIISRKGSQSSKWERYAGRDVLPFWVADMDFPAPPFVLEAVRERLKHPILGYTDIPDSFAEVIVNWAAREFDWYIHPDWIVYLPGIVPGMNLALRTIAPSPASCLLMTPVYPPILRMPSLAGMSCLKSRLALSGNRWVMDFDDLRRKARNSDAMILCNPQNPTGRVYTTTELKGLAELCCDHDITLLSDEIHWGLVLDTQARHVPIATLDEEIANQSMTFFAATKSYNIAGLNMGFAVIPSPSLRKPFEELVLHSIGPPLVLSLVANEAAFSDRSPWRPELCAYLRANRDLLNQTVNALPGLSTTHVEGTHLAWIDARGLEVDDPHAMLEAFGLGLSNGSEFDGDGFVRFNFAAPRDFVRKGLDRLTTAVTNLNPKQTGSIASP